MEPTTPLALPACQESRPPKPGAAPETPRPLLVGNRVMMPLETEVLREHRAWVTGVKYEPGRGLIIELDIRRHNWQIVLGLGRGVKVRWADVRKVDIRELSNTPWPLFYRLTYGDGWYKDKDGHRVHFPLQPHLPGIDLMRGCTTLTMRAAVLLAVVAGVGVRCVSWLMQLLFLVDVSKSGVDRWVRECGAQLPDGEGMAKILHRLMPITEGHFDEIFAVGQRPKRCTLVLRDEHGRVFAIEQVEKRTTDVVVQFLQKVKGWGINPQTFYMDGCEEYRDAVKKVFPHAAIQYDLFHVIQNVIKKLWKAVVARRKDIKKQGESATTPDSGRLVALAKRIWEKRYLFFKREENLSDEERAALLDLLEADPLLERVRGFMLGVWATFNDSKTEAEAREKLGLVGKRAEETEKGSAFRKAFKFLDGRFSDMIAFLRYPGVRPNSLAETGIRFLRRLEQGHDGFRGPEGLDCYLRIYQAVKYCGWTVHRFTPGLGLPSTLFETAAASPTTGAPNATEPPDALQPAPAG